MEDSKIFDQQYSACLPRVKTTDFSQKTELLGIRKQNQLYIFDFFNRQIAFDGNNFFDIDGEELTPAVKVVLCNYVLRCPEKAPKASNRLVTFREFENAGPLFSRFAENTGKIMTTTFSGQMDKLTSRCRQLGAAFLQTGSYDLSAKFYALPRIPVILNFNDTDELMPASAVFLYYDDAETYLDLECLTVICTFLTGLLIQA